MVGKDEARTNYILLSSTLIEFFTWKDSIKINQPVIKFETDARIFFNVCKAFCFLDYQKAVTKRDMKI